MLTQQILQLQQMSQLDPTTANHYDAASNVNIQHYLTQKINTVQPNCEYVLLNNYVDLLYITFSMSDTKILCKMRNAKLID